MKLPIFIADLHSFQLTKWKTTQKIALVTPPF